MVDEDRARSERGERAVRSKRHGAQIVVIADTGEHELGAVGRFGRGACGVAAEPREESVRFGAAAVEHHEVMAPAGGEMAGHGKAHHPEADKGDFAHDAISPASSFRRKPESRATGTEPASLDTGLRRYDGAKVTGGRKTWIAGSSPAMTWHEGESEAALGDGRVGERELLAGAPLIGDVIDDQRRAHALDRTLLEAVEGIIRGHEDHRRIGREG